MEKVIIAGGTGLVGHHLRKILLEQGHKVITVSRKPGSSTQTWSDLDRHGIPDDITAVVNVAGENILNPLKRWTPDFMEKVRSSRIESNKKLVSYISQSKNPPKVFATISGVAGYKPSPTEVYTEDSPVQDFDFLSKLVIDWEAAAKLPEDVKTRQFIVRSGVVLAGDGGMVQQLYPSYFLCQGGKIGKGTQWLPWIHVHDLAGIFHHGIITDSVTGVLNGVSPHSVTNQEFSEALAKSMSRPALLPGFLNEIVMKTMFGQERAKIILEGQNVSPARTQEKGYIYKYADINNACKEAVANFSWRRN
ncbi:epimerase family protein SDR39U1-like [Mizuhopecten yessoensis]|uniref:Epimerase family protein SDR39U1 n=1 Tax=Mizuhopecten yessoensis TaxID=6573 RepID=A0A210PE64_MIZYE|nr:epimerase family protein SDR39U1-like [Mizuhopecten yessoensis]XP_021343781.1 epimerase family protein SDR39U1-like [Mizuhopecten yessoensis]OWF34774.1 Epimerase family protein SDR39U1 [Mizuhopecten yessoensis]